MYYKRCKGSWIGAEGSAKARPGQMCVWCWVEGGGILFEAYVPSVERSHKASKSLHHEDLHVTCSRLTNLSKLHGFHSEYTRIATLHCHLPRVLNHHNLVSITLQILPSIFSTPYVKKSFLAESRMGFIIIGLDSI